LTMPQGPDSSLPIGKTLLTKVGQELAPVVGGTPIDGFWEYVQGMWTSYLTKMDTDKPPATSDSGVAEAPPSVS
jgi:hypothetical protein